MTKKIFIALTILFATFFLSSSVFASNSIENGMKDIGSETKDSWNKIGGAVQNVGDNAKSAMDNMGDKAKSMMNIDDNKDNNNDDNYQATRTSSMTDNNNLFGMSSTTWTWFILGIVGAVIVALVWYYSYEQTNTRHNNKSEH